MLIRDRFLFKQHPRVRNFRFYVIFIQVVDESWSTYSISNNYMHQSPWVLHVSLYGDRVRFYVMLDYVMLCYVMLCYVMLCYVMLCYVMLCYVMLCYVMLC